MLLISKLLSDLRHTLYISNYTNKKEISGVPPRVT